MSRRGLEVWWFVGDPAPLARDNIYALDTWFFEWSDMTVYVTIVSHKPPILSKIFLFSGCILEDFLRSIRMCCSFNYGFRTSDTVVNWFIQENQSHVIKNMPACWILLVTRLALYSVEWSETFTNEFTLQCCLIGQRVYTLSVVLQRAAFLYFWFCICISIVFWYTHWI